MSTLDNKLREIIFGDTPEHFMSASMLAKPEQIKQVFADAGYERKTDFMEGGGYLSLDESPVVQWLHDNGWQSGQEWYDRFTKEWQVARDRKEYTIEEMIAAAKRAAGL